MKRADVIRLSGAAGMRASTQQPAVNAVGRTVPVEWLERFAALVEAEVRKEIEAAVLAEREAIAQWYAIDGWLMDESDIADAIRARPQLEPRKPT